MVLCHATVGMFSYASRVLLLCCVVWGQGLDAEISCVRGELKELSGLIKAQEEGLRDFKEVREGGRKGGG